MTEFQIHQPDAESSATQLVRPDRDKLEALAEFAAGAGHEINNPLATIIGRVQLLLKDEKDAQRRQMLLAIGAQAYRIRDMIGDTMLFGRPPRPAYKSIGLRQTVDLIVAKQADDLLRDGCQVEIDIPNSLSVKADESQLATVMSELLRNSRQATKSQEGRIAICAFRTNDTVHIDVHDNGKGFTETERVHAFDPFFSGRQAGRGLGFGLPKCWRIIDQHNGRIEIESAPNGPTVVRINWPAA